MKKDYNIIFNEVCELVSKGLTISKALKHLKADSHHFYENINDEQRRKLKELKILNAVSGYSFNYCEVNKMFINNED